MYGEIGILKFFLVPSILQVPYIFRLWHVISCTARSGVTLILLSKAQENSCDSSGSQIK